jgi:hypothetical protein
MDHPHDSEIPEDILSGFRRSWPGHDSNCAIRPLQRGSLLEMLPLGLGGLARRRSLTGWPVKLSSPGS